MGIIRPTALAAPFLLSAVAAGCPGDQGDQGDAASTVCSPERENIQGKLSAELLRFYDASPGPRRVLITHKTSANVQPLPECTNCGGCRECPERNAAIAALDRMVMELQRCTVERITAVGGEFLERFWLGNIISARLSRSQALEVAALVDVRLIEDAEAPGPPPP